MYIFTWKRILMYVRIVVVLPFILFSLQIANGILFDKTDVFIPYAYAAAEASDPVLEGDGISLLEEGDVVFEPPETSEPNDSGIQVIPIGGAEDTTAEKEKESDSISPEGAMQSMMAGSGGSSQYGGSFPTPDTSLFTGSARTTIPIEVPPGRNGIQPNLAFRYNSSQSNGWLGVGWSLDRSPYRVGIGLLWGKN
jgi:hypothetical protein